jgi:HNH endonuclease
MYLFEHLRNFIIKRAKGCCEYCLVHEDDMFWRYHIDHIISQKHGGSSEEGNLAYCCSVCNQYKGTDLGTYLAGSQRLIRLFNPRKDKWHIHFEISEGEIIAKTKIGAATVKVLNLNDIDRVILRQVLTEENRYP